MQTHDGNCDVKNGSEYGDHLRVAASFTKMLLSHGSRVAVTSFVACD